MTSAQAHAPINLSNMPGVVALSGVLLTIAGVITAFALHTRSETRTWRFSHLTFENTFSTAKNLVPIEFTDKPLQFFELQTFAEKYKLDWQTAEESLQKNIDELQTKVDELFAKKKISDSLHTWVIDTASHHWKIKTRSDYLEKKISHLEAMQKRAAIKTPSFTECMAMIEGFSQATPATLLPPEQPQ
jgi:superfamily I DNA and RNA helicase